MRATFGWMHLATEPPAAPTPDIKWLTADDEDGDRPPDSQSETGVVPVSGRPDARHWAGIRAAEGSLLAAGADSWPAPGLRLISGVATHPGHRGGGLSTMLCAFLTGKLAREEAVTLMVDADNELARRVYRGLGYR
ncbi:GNAT family N-acetyltransferase [Saccharopolyspora sp. NPDC000995]